MNNDFLSQICSHYYVCTYIQCGHIWHRNKLSRCQLELLASCSNDGHQTSLKWDRSSHPVAAECRVSHTIHLKNFTVLQWRFREPNSLRLNVPVDWPAGCYVRYKWSRRFPQDKNMLCLNRLIYVSKVAYILFVGTFLDIYDYLKRSYLKFHSTMFCYLSEGCWSNCILCVTLNH
jgi:hypothetical protein